MIINGILSKRKVIWARTLDNNKIMLWKSECADSDRSGLITGVVLIAAGRSNVVKIIEGDSCSPQMALDFNFLDNFIDVHVMWCIASWGD